MENYGDSERRLKHFIESLNNISSAEFAAKFEANPRKKAFVSNSVTKKYIKIMQKHKHDKLCLFRNLIIFSWK